MNLQKTLSYWLPPIIWMSAIFFFSTDSLSSENTGSILGLILNKIFPGIDQGTIYFLHLLIRKGAHFVEYLILAVLLMRALRGDSAERWRWSWAVGTLSVIIIYALLDEYHQSFTRSRTASVYDSLIDTCGGLFGIILIRRFWRRAN